MAFNKYDNLSNTTIILPLIYGVITLLSYYVLNLILDLPTDPILRVKKIFSIMEQSYGSYSSYALLIESFKIIISTSCSFFIGFSIAKKISDKPLIRGSLGAIIYALIISLPNLSFFFFGIITLFAFLGNYLLGIYIVPYFVFLILMGYFGARIRIKINKTNINQ